MIKTDYVGKLRELIESINEYRWQDAYELTFQLENEIENTLLYEFGEPNKVSDYITRLRLYISKNIRDDLKSKECRRIISEMMNALSPYGIGTPSSSSYNSNHDIRIDNIIEAYMNRIDRQMLDLASIVTFQTPEFISQRHKIVDSLRVTLTTLKNVVRSYNTDRVEVISVIEKLVIPEINSCLGELIHVMYDPKKGFENLSLSIKTLKEGLSKLVSLIRHPEETDVILEAIEDVLDTKISKGKLGEKKKGKKRKKKEEEESEESEEENVTQTAPISIEMPPHFDWIDEDWLLVLQHPRIYTIIGHRGGGKCLAKGTWVVAKDGSLIEIEKFNNREIVCVDLNDYKVKVGWCSQVMYSGKQKVYRVVLDTGREVLATDNHPFLTINGWVKLKDLKVGDRIATPKRINVFGNEDLDENLVKVIAYLLGDGSVIDSLKFTNKNPLIVEDFKRAVEALGLAIRVERPNTYVIKAKERYIKKYPDPEKEGTNAVELYKKGYSISQIAKALNKHYWAVWRILNKAGVIRSSKEGLRLVIGNWLKLLLKDWGLVGANAGTKFIPDPIFRLPKEKLALFINRLFACDGSVHYDGKKVIIEYASKSKKLIKQLQHLLLRFGIISFIREKVVNGTTYYRLFIWGKNVDRFREEIGIFTKEIPKIERTHNPNKDTLPKEVWNIIKAEIRAKGYNFAELARKLGVNRKYIVNSTKYAPSKEKVLKIANAINSDLLRKLASDDIYWDRIVRIEEVGVMDTYDIETQFSNFIANDIVVHNSAAAHTITEFLHYNYRIKAYFFNVYDRPVPAEKRSLLPDWMEIIDDLDDAQNNSVVLIDEAYLKFHARTSMREAHERVAMDKILELSRQKALSLIFVTQRSTKLDKNIIQATDTYIIRRIHQMQIDYERQEVRKMLERAFEAFRKIPRTEMNKYCYVVAQTDGYEGLKRIGLPSYWTEELSHFYEGF